MMILQQRDLLRYEGERVTVDCHVFTQSGNEETCSPLCRIKLADAGRSDVGGIAAGAAHFGGAAGEAGNEAIHFFHIQLFVHWISPVGC